MPRKEHGQLWISGDTVLYKGVRDVPQRLRVGTAMLRHLLGVAADRNYRRVSLETGTMDAFAPARSLYA